MRYARRMRDRAQSMANAEGVLAGYGLQQAWGLYQNRAGSKSWAHGVVCDIVDRLIDYGTVSPKQVTFLGNLLARIEAEKNAPAVPALGSGKQAVTGEVVSTKYYPGRQRWGGYRGMTVKTAAGQRVWAKIAAGADVQTGDVVSFTAVLSPKEGEPGFAFAKKVAGLTKAGAVAPAHAPGEIYTLRDPAVAAIATEYAPISMAEMNTQLAEMVEEAEAPAAAPKLSALEQLAAQYKVAA